jgi:hypothetical protein
MNYTLFTGCSFVAGHGLDYEKNDPDLWVNLLHQAKFQNTQLLNQSRSGRANAGIFQDTVNSLVTYPVNTAVVCWTSVPRLELVLGLELYDTSQVFGPNNTVRDHALNTSTVSKKYLQDLENRLLTLTDLHHEILMVVFYTNCLIKLAEKTGTQIFFVNTLCPWDLDFFVEKTDENLLPSDYTKFTQNLLQAETRDDKEIHLLYKKIHQDYNSHGGIKQHHWLNLYNSLHQQQIDYGNDNIHPGYKSQHIFFDFLQNLI